MATEILDRPNRWRRRLRPPSPPAWRSSPVARPSPPAHEGRELRARLSARETQLAALEDTLSVLRRANKVLQTQISMNGHHGGLLIFQDAVSHRWCVIVHGLPPAPAGSMYQFWFITETGMVRSVEVNADMQRPGVHDAADARRRRAGDGGGADDGVGGQPLGGAEGVTLAHVVF